MDTKEWTRHGFVDVHKPLVFGSCAVEANTVAPRSVVGEAVVSKGAACYQLMLYTVPAHDQVGIVGSRLSDESGNADARGPAKTKVLQIWVCT